MIDGLKSEAGRAQMLEMGGVRGHICSWEWLTSLAHLSHVPCELEVRSS